MGCVWGGKGSGADSETEENRGEANKEALVQKKSNNGKKPAERIKTPERKTNAAPNEQLHLQMIDLCVLC